MQFLEDGEQTVVIRPESTKTNSITSICSVLINALWFGCHVVQMYKCTSAVDIDIRLINCIIDKVSY